MVSPDSEPFYGLGRATNQGFDCAVPAVAYPATEIQRLGFGMERPAEADALNTAMNAETPGNRFVH